MSNTITNQENDAVAIVKRISWGAIIGGSLLALVIQIVLSLLGMSIGLGVFNPASGGASATGIGFGTGIWLVLSSLIALFIGGYVASHLAGLPTKIDAILQGILAWALVTLLTVYLMTSAVGGILSGAAGVVGQGLQLAGQGVAAVAPDVADDVQQKLESEGFSLDKIKAEANKLLRQTDKQELKPASLEQRAKRAAQAAEGAAVDAGRTPKDAEAELGNALDKLLQLGKDTVEEADREAVINVIAARSDMSRAEAERTVDQYIKQLEQAKQKAAELTMQAEEAAEEAAEKTAGALASAAFWMFITMLIGAIAAAVGGAMGRPEDAIVR